MRMLGAHLWGDLLDGLNTRVVIPLAPRDRYPQGDTPEDLMPAFTIKGKRYVLETPKMGAVPVGVLKERVGSLVQHQLKIMSAVDRLLRGF
jgi:toxin CcdB